MRAFEEVARRDGRWTKAWPGIYFAKATVDVLMGPWELWWRLPMREGQIRGLDTQGWRVAESL